MWSIVTNLLGKLPPLKTILIVAGVILLLTGVASGVAYYRAHVAFKAKEQALRQEVEAPYQAEIEQQKQALAEDAKRLLAAKKESAKLKLEVNRLLEERNKFLAEAETADKKRAEVREEVARVPDSQVRGRLRAGLLRLRTGGPGQGG